MKDLKGRNALLTGGSRGLGPYIGRALAREGVNLALTARTADALAAVGKELAGFGVRTTAITADITERSGREKLVQRVTDEMGPIDILVNNAGMEWLSHYTSLSPEYIETMIQTNLVAPLILARLVLPDMLERGTGHIVMMSSLGGKRGAPFSATYAGTKAALIEWTRGIRAEMRGTGVSASVICPGFVAEAGMFADYEKRAPWIAGESKPEQVAKAVIRAIKADLEELAVNPGPVKLMTVVNAVSPGVMGWVFRTSGLYDFYRRQAEENERKMER